MTVVIGLETAEGVYIAGDSAATDGETMRRTALPKVVAVGPFVIGYTDSFRMGQLLEHQLWNEIAKRPEQESKEPDLSYLVWEFIPAVRELFAKGGFVWSENGRESGGCFLLAYKGTLYTVYSDFQVNRPLDGFDALGAGADLALACLKYEEVMGRSQKAVTPAHALHATAETAASLSLFVTSPFNVLFQPKAPGQPVQQLVWKMGV